MTVAAFDMVAPADMRAGARGTWLRWVPALLIALAAIARQATTWLDCDVSWLLTVGEHVLDGQRLYTDIIETNPPASVLLYLPAIMLARATGTTPEFVTASLVFLLGLVSILGSSRMLARAGMLPGRLHPVVVTVATACFLLMPGYCFAQREHIAVLLVLPIMASAALGAEGHRIGRTASVLSGLGAGIAMAIKPHFVLAIAPMILFAAWRRRSFRPLFGIEVAIAASVVLAYGAIVVACFPHFIDEMIPMLRVAYLPARASPLKLLATGWCILTVASLLLAVALAPRRATRTVLALPLLASAGFAAAAMVQGKGYINHGYPAVALASFGLILALAGKHPNTPGHRIGAALVALFAGTSVTMFLQLPDYARLEMLVRQAGPVHPRMLMVGGNLSIAHPVVRWVGGQWVGRQHSLWITADAPTIHSPDPAERAALARYVAQDERMFVEDVAEGRPDIVLIQGDAGLRWIGSHPDVSAVLARYRPIGRTGEAIVWALPPGGA